MTKDATVPNRSSVECGSTAATGEFDNRGNLFSQLGFARSQVHFRNWLADSADVAAALNCGLLIR
ncbi:MAG: hypothetical protein ACK5OR_04300, partial [Betaproteobacteria bacterium]